MEHLQNVLSKPKLCRLLGADYVHVMVHMMGQQNEQLDLIYRSTWKILQTDVALHPYQIQVA